MHQIASLARQTRLVFGRSLRAGLREPALAFVFPVAFPLLIIGLFSQVYARVADLPGFPTGSYLGWLTPAAVAGLGVLAVAVALGAPMRGGPLAVLTVAVLLAGWTSATPASTTWSGCGPAAPRR